MPKPTKGEKALGDIIRRLVDFRTGPMFTDLPAAAQANVGLAANTLREAMRQTQAADEERA